MLDSNASREGYLSHIHKKNSMKEAPFGRVSPTHSAVIKGGREALHCADPYGGGQMEWRTECDTKRKIRMNVQIRGSAPVSGAPVIGTPQTKNVQIKERDPEDPPVRNTRFEKRQGYAKIFGRGRRHCLLV